MIVVAWIVLEWIKSSIGVGWDSCVGWGNRLDGVIEKR